MDRSTITEEALLLDVKSIAKMLGVSWRTVYRLSDAGKMPRPLKVGSHLVRWNRAAVEAWIIEGCPSCRKGAAR